YLIIVSISFSFQGIVLLSRTALNVLKKPFYAVSLIIIQMFILYIPLSLLGAKLFEVKGVFAAAAISYFSAGTIGYLIFNKIIKKMRGNYE
nr:MATE family efflux transporter [Candidatus Cloacimonadota bacterium]